MPPLQRSEVVFVVLVCLGASVLLAQQKRDVPSTQCNEKTSCFPWNVLTGPTCAKGNKIGIRFMLDIATDRVSNGNDGIESCGINTGPDTSRYVTYAFCPRVDELQAFNLSNSSKMAATWVNTALEPGNQNQITAGDLTTEPRYLRVYGLGTADSIEIPNNATSLGAVQVVGMCPDDVGGSATSADPQIAIVPFLIMNITMKNGKFQYFADIPQSLGVGFVPTCETDDQGRSACTLDGSMKCIGRDGQKNCAKCFSNDQYEEVAALNTLIWTSYYGTDRLGRPMRSGSNNPLNFRKYSGGSMYSSLSSSLNNVREGDFNGDPQDTGTPT